MFSVIKRSVTDEFIQIFIRYKTPKWCYFCNKPIKPLADNNSWVYEYNDDKVFIKRTKSQVQKIITLSEETAYIRLAFYYFPIESWGETDTLQIELENSIISYEPYKKIS